MEELQVSSRSFLASYNLLELFNIQFASNYNCYDKLLNPTNHIIGNKIIISVILI